MRGTRFGKVLSKLRGEADLSQEELAHLAGISVAALKRIEDGTTKAPHPRTISRLVNALRLTDGDEKELRDTLEPAEASGMEPWSRRRREAPSGDVADAVRHLAHRVRRQWGREAVRRQLHRPLPLTMRWTRAPQPLMDRDEVILAAALGGRRSARAGERLALTGADSLVQEFQKLPLPRLVVLGGWGSGKTGQLLLLALDLLRDPSPDLVPVLLTLSSWQPDREPFHDWVRRRLLEDNPNLRSFGADAVQSLVYDHVLPLLDGLDELPAAARAAAMSAIEVAGPSQPLVIACRTEEYGALVATSDPLRAAAAVELQPVAADDAVDYLRMGIAQEANLRRWDPVFAELHRHPHGTLAAALSTPLMVSLARTIYERDPAEPSELLDRQRYASAEAIEDALLDKLVDAEYGMGPERRWLTFLATNLQQRGTYDLAWWELVPRRRFAAPAMGVVFATVFGFVGWLLHWVYGPIAMAEYGAIFGVFVTAIPRRPRRTVLRLDRPLGAALLAGWLRGVQMTLGFGVLLALLAGFMGAAAGQPWLGLRLALLLLLGVGLLTGSVIGPVVGLANGVVRRADQPPSPALALSTDRSALVLAIILSLAGGAVSFGLGMVASAALDRAFPFNIPLLSSIWSLMARTALPLVVCALIAVAFGAFPWSLFQVFRSWFALTGRLPLHTIRFLEGACDKGVLRRDGAVYQFRHRRLQDRLAGGGLATGHQWFAPSGQFAWPAPKCANCDEILAPWGDHCSRCHAPARRSRVPEGRVARALLAAAWTMLWISERPVLRQLTHPWTCGPVMVLVIVAMAAGVVAFQALAASVRAGVMTAAAVIAVAVAGGLGLVWRLRRRDA